jgi:16S rRNA (cytosine1402-N4)-methyltransferase
VFHEPVLLKEAISLLINDETGIYVDGTLGGGGHAEAILERLQQPGCLIGLDQDRDALTTALTRLERFAKQVVIRPANFVETPEILKSLKIDKINGLLLDLGVSSHQINTPERGFSFSASGQLDMRMNREQAASAYEIVNSYSEVELSELIKNLGEERRHRSIARAIVKVRAHKPILSTLDLADTIGAVMPYEHRVKSLARVFQALRITVNNELENLRATLTESLNFVKAGGRLVIISYHSLEDRIVKEFFKKESSHCVCPPELPICVCGQKGRLKALTKRPIRPTHLEVQQNPRSRSSRLRAAEIL